MKFLRLVPLFFLFCFSACSREQSPKTPTHSVPQRIITFTPSLTEIAFALGVGDRVLGTTDWCHYPAEAKAKEKLGGVGTPNYERVVALHPDLFLIASYPKLKEISSLEEVAKKIEKLGIPILRVPCESLSDIGPAIDLMGKTLDRETQAKQLRQEMEQRLENVSKKLEGVQKKKVLVVLERQAGTVLDLSVVGPNNVIDSLIQLAGGENIFQSSTLPYPKASKEEILQKDPEFIFDFSVHGYSEQGDDEKEKLAWNALPTLRAVKEKKIFVMPSGFDLYPGPRIPQIVEYFAKIFHPEKFQ